MGVWKMVLTWLLEKGLKINKLTVAAMEEAPMDINEIQIQYLCMKGTDIQDRVEHSDAEPKSKIHRIRLGGPRRAGKI